MGANNAGSNFRGNWRHTSGNGLLRYSAASLPLALALSETFPRFLILALLLLPGLARVVVSHALSLRLLPRSTPVVIFRPICGEALGMSRHHCGER
jgi:hypothetical protein